MEDEDLQGQLNESLEVPEDIVPRQKMTSEGLQQLEDMAGREVEISYPGKFIEDVDGNVIGVEPPMTEMATMTAPVISKAERQSLKDTSE